LESGASTATLSDSEILGNAFVFILAGHETAANTIHYSLLYLAMNPSSQRHLQKDLETQGFTSKNPEDWDYDHDLPKLFGGMAVSTTPLIRLLPTSLPLYRLISFNTQ